MGLGTTNGMLSAMVGLAIVVGCESDRPGGGRASSDAADGGVDVDGTASRDSGDPRDAGDRDSAAPDGGDGGVADAGLDGGVAEPCTGCHGGPEQPAPPVDTQGRSSTELPTVGAHRTHLRPNAYGRRTRCDDCHLVPRSAEAPGHIDPSPAELTWGPIARADGVTPAYEGGTCNVYCHGASLSGGLVPQPRWTAVGDGQAYCGSCHGVPPPSPHPRLSGSTSCGPCHPFEGLVSLDADAHIDGVLDVREGCTDCHGGPTGPAPPVDVRGNSASTFVGVGAHAAHGPASTWHAGVACTECHVVPSTTGSPGHLDGDGVAEVSFGGLATTDGAAASWDGATCAVYCHGDTLSGGSNPTPEWTRVGVGQASCGSCHGLPPPAPHPQNPRCADCHGAVVDASLSFVDPSLHINGLVDEDTACGDCHGLPPSTGAHSAHAGLAAATYGGLGLAKDMTSPSGYAFGCGHCHPRDSSRHRNGGRAEIELHDASSPVGTIKALHPASAFYVAGPVELTDAFGLTYTEGTCSNVYCHSGIQTTSGAVAVPGDDFPFTGYPILYTPAPTVNRTRAYEDVGWGEGSITCDGCHGFPARSRHPSDRAAAGESHAFIGADGRETLHMFNHGYDPIACRVCHAQTALGVPTYVRDAQGLTTIDPIPIDGFSVHVDGVVDVEIDTSTSVPYGRHVDLAGASWDASSRTCSNVPCHLDQTAVEFGEPHRPDVTAECNQCHRM